MADSVSGSLSTISRRAFLVSAACGGGAVAFGFPPGWLAADAAAAAPEGVELFNWVVIAPDNTVTVRIAQMEMGQGATTAMAQLLAEELAAGWSTLKTEPISIATHLARGKVYGWTRTVASLGVKISAPVLRAAGAQIRTALVAAAAQRLGVPAAELSAENSAVMHAASGRRLLYGELAADAAGLVARSDPKSLPLKPPQDWTLIGKSVPRLDIPAKTNGTAVFGIDVRLPGMQHAAIAMCPVYGGTAQSFDAVAALTRPGVRKVVAIDEGRTVAVVADEWWQARTAVDAMPIAWDTGAAAPPSSEAIRDGLYAGLEAGPQLTLRDDGDVHLALAGAAMRLEAEYFVPYLEHATLEPMTCTALVTEDRFEVWAPTQVPETAINIAAEVAEMDVSAGELHPTLIGGGFGRRQMSDYVRQAVEIAKAMKGTPVKLLWSREDTTRNGFYRPPSLSRVQAGLDASGNLTAWWHRIVSHARDPVQSTFGADSLLYAVPHMRVDQVVRDPYLPAAPMRGVGYAMNSFATQSAMDELAVAAGVDAYRFQRALLDPAKARDYVPPSAFPDFDGVDPATRASRLRAVLDEAARRSGWSRRLPRNSGRGIAVNEEASSYFAAVAEVTLDDEGWFHVDRVVVAGDPGFLVNPDAATAQVEGSVAFGLTSAMYGEITIRDGAVVESNFHDYPMLRIDEMPQVEVHWKPNRDVWGGIGEPAAAVVIPAVTNAIYDAGGPRIRALPLKSHRIERRR